MKTINADVGVKSATHTHVKCSCGEITGEPCTWTGSRTQTVSVEWMPEWLRESHSAAGNSGAYPHNGAIRIVVNRDCATRIAEWEDPEWFTHRG